MTDPVGVDFFIIRSLLSKPPSHDDQDFSTPTILFDSDSRSRVRFDSFNSINAKTENDIVEAISADLGIPMRVKISNLLFLTPELAELPLLAYQCRLPNFDLNHSDPTRAADIFGKMFPFVTNSWNLWHNDTVLADLFNEERHFHENFNMSSESNGWSIIGELIQGTCTLVLYICSKSLCTTWQGKKIENIIGEVNITMSRLLQEFKIFEQVEPRPLSLPAGWTYKKPKVQDGVETGTFFNAVFCDYEIRKDKVWIFIAEGDKVGSVIIGIRQ